jgi:hypothetical protein
LNEAPPLGITTATARAATAREVGGLWKTALEEAKLVRDDVLEKALAGLSKPFREKYQRSLELRIQGIEQRDDEIELAGSRLHNEWVVWINAHRAEVMIPK